MSKITKIGLPPGGTTGQVLKKKTGTNYDVEWGTGGGGGSVTSVATTSPITGGTITTTGTIGITQATTSTDGYLSSTDWNTFNNKQSALTNPVTGTGTTNYLPKFTGASTIGNSQVRDDGTGVSIGGAPSAFKFDVTGLVNFTGTTASDGGQLGAELLSAAGWTSTGWTGSFGAGWTHTVGNTTALTNTLAAVNNTYYYISFTVTGRTAGTFTISFGGYTSGSLSATANVGPLTTSTASLSITPTTDFDGTIVISIKQITGGNANLTIKNSSGGNLVQIRSTQGDNFFIGANAGARVIYSANYGYGNIGIGESSLVGLTTGIGNTAVGKLAAYQTTYGNYNTAIGVSALQQNKSGGSNTTIGWNSGFTLSSGGSNTAIGTNALYSNVSANNNVAIGSSALTFSTGSGNTAVGAQSIGNNTSGTNNTALGLVAALNNSTGSNFVSVGANSTRYYAGGTSAATSFSNGVYIGDTTKVGAAGAANEVVIGYQAEGLGSNTTVIGNSSTTYGRWWGNLLIGTSTNSGYALDVNGTARIQNDLTISDTRNIILSTTTGTKIGTATTQKIGFFNATPVVQPSAVTTAQGIADALSSLGLLASSTVAGGESVGSKLYLFNSY